MRNESMLDRMRRNFSVALGLAIFPEDRMTRGPSTKQKIIGVNRVVAAVFLFILLGLNPTLAQPVFGPTQNPLGGSRVFGVKGCSKCHAVNGVGGKIGPDLGRIPRPRSFYDLAAAMWNHLPRMTERMQQLGIPRPQINPQETGDLIAFLFTLDYFDPPGNIRAGRRLFAEKRCVVCHQVAGTGGVVGPNLDALKQYGSPIFVAAAMWNHGPAMAEAMRARKIDRPTFKDSELLDLIAYIKSASSGPVEGPLYVLPGRAEDGRRLFVEKRCIECHSVGAGGGRVGPDLAERGSGKSLTQFATAMWNKAPAMTGAARSLGISIPQLRAEEMADLIAYLYSVRYLTEPGDPRRGRKLARDKGCLRCHALEGKGGQIGPDLALTKGLDSPPTVISTLWNHGGVMAQEAQRRKIPWPELRPDEMADLVAFLQGLGRT